MMNHESTLSSRPSAMIGVRTIRSGTTPAVALESPGLALPARYAEARPSDAGRTSAPLCGTEVTQ